MEHIVSLIVLLVFCFLLPLECRTRKPAVSGKWYPSNPQELANDLKDYLDKAELSETQNQLEPLGIMVPHAGYMFSAPVAAWCYKLLENKKYDTVILLGSSHHYAAGIVSVYDGDKLQTPLGEIPVDRKLAQQIIAGHPHIDCNDAIHAIEHSNEAQLPFLQYLLKDFQVVSILTSTNDKKLLLDTADIIYQAIAASDKKVLLVLSTDMSHFHNYDLAKKMDQETIDLIITEQWQTLAKKINWRDCELCGFHAFEIFQKIMQLSGSDKPVLLQYANSGDAHPEYGLDSVVGYGAIVFPQKMNPEKSISSDDDKLTAEEKKWLLNLARKSIIDSLNHANTAIPKPDNRLLRQERAVFVTLHKKGNLRGCIGHMIARDQLYKAVWQMAQSAAFADPRFDSIELAEMADIVIEISVLSPMQKVKTIDEIVMGRDGVLVQQGYHSGVFLPQVARETGWDKETFLRQLCSSKALLPPDAYLDPQTEIYIFQVEEFSE
ncbi:MAG: AmmeMemoRadiSam system protein B [Candidatus Cloacimonetes bacterium]|nr:AmmeMemoRadiSam system protein B [Candidatus Cloacimonadota bacterium]